jgi:signal transduction histidine kinase/ActR/RegA family two-component response regulator
MEKERPELLAAATRWLTAAGAAAALIGFAGILSSLHRHGIAPPPALASHLGLIALGVSALANARARPGLSRAAALTAAAAGIAATTSGGDAPSCLLLLAAALLLASRRNWTSGAATQSGALLSAASLSLAAVSLAAALVLAAIPESAHGIGAAQTMTLSLGEAAGIACLAAALVTASWLRTQHLTGEAPRWIPMAGIVVLSVTAAALYRAQNHERSLRLHEWFRGGGARFEDLHSPLPEVTLAFGLLTAVLVGIIVEQFLRAQRRIRDAEAAHRVVERVIQERKQDIVELQRSQKMLRLYATELQRKNEEYDTALKTAREAVEHKGRFIANTSHEIRTPMNGIIGMTELLLTSRLDPEQRELAITVKESADSLLHILNDILDFSKVEAGRMQFDSAPFDPGDTLASVVSLWMPRAVASGLRLTHHTDADVPDLVCGDQVRVRQVLTNLIGNALKFTEQGSVRVGIDLVSAGTHEARLRFDVADTGIGIPSDKLAHIFESFTQVDDSTTRRHGGTGLGLAISKQLVEAMGGRIQVESQLGVGSRFSFEIPFQLPQTLPEFAAAPNLGDEAPEPGRPTPRVLLVEDNLVNRRVALRMLEKEGCIVDGADNGELAVQALDAAFYDIIFMDVQMPVMDGLTATRIIRAREGNLRHTPIVALTAGALEGDRDRCLNAGMDDYLAKPFTQDGIRKMLLRWAARPPSDRPAPAGQTDSLSAA